MSLPKTYKAAFMEKAGEPLVFRDVELKLPERGQVLVKVIACGVCHTDVDEKNGLYGDLFPRVPGHELVGDVVAVGESVSKVTEGDRVGGPWHGGHDGSCRQCNRAQFQMCDNAQINGITRDGGYAEYVLLREEAVVRVPRDADPAAVAPLLCAGVATFNAMRKQRVEQGSLVAVQGLGGLGHLAVQFARAMGYRTVAVSSGAAKRDFALGALGAHEHVDAARDDPVAELKRMGGAAMILATAPSPAAIGPLVGGLQPGGRLVVLAPVGPVAFDTLALVTLGASVSGWPSGHALDSEEAIAFATSHGVRCMSETFAFADADRAMEHCVSGRVRFRAVLTM